MIECFFFIKGVSKMAKKRTKITQYTRNRNRIQAYIRKLKKAGLNVDFYFPTEKELRKSGVKGKELTKLTLELKKLTAKELIKIATPLNKQEPTITPGFEPPEKLLESGISNVIIQNFKSQVLHFPKEISDKIISLINTLISEQGIDDVAGSLQNMPMQFYEYFNRQGYDSNSAVQEFASALIEYLPNASDGYKADLMDAFEYNELGYTVES